MDLDKFIDQAVEAPQVIGAEKVTVLHVLHGRASKQISSTETKGYRVGKFFNIEERPINSIFDLFEVLKNLRRDPKKFIIRGRPVGPQRTHVLRRCVGEDATFTDAPIRWACIDLDGIGEIKGPPKPEIEDFISRQPQLDGVRCVAQISSSWGVKPGIRAHLWYWLDEPRTSRQVSEWAASLPFKTDHSLYNPVQPHYTADPEFVGVDDPVTTDRVFMLNGDSDSLYVPSGQMETEIQYWVDKIIHIDDDEPRHPLINRAAYSIGGWVGAGVLGADEASDILMRACEDSGAFEDSRLSDADNEIGRALADGARNPRNHEDWRSGMIRTKEGAIKPLPENYARIFKTHAAVYGCFGFDVRTQQTTIVKRPPWGGDVPRVITDSDDVEACGWINRLGVHTSAVGLVSSALTAAACEHPIDRVVDWLESLPAWDRQKRLYEWLPRVTGCPNTKYHRGVGAKFILSLVARALQPGCKMDEMLVLVGPQGSFKSTLLYEVVNGPGDWAFSDCLGDIRKPTDYIPSLMGPWLIEVAELASFSKKEVEAVKKFLSTRTDRHRLAYGRRAVEMPRRGIIAGSSNNTNFLSDITGNRRFWPVDVENIDISKLRAVRDQLFAEAVHLFKGGAHWHLDAAEAEEAKVEQDRHRAYDPWEDLIIEYIGTADGMTDLDDIADSVREVVTVKEIANDVLRIPAGQAHQGQYARIGGILKSLGWEKFRGTVRGTRQWAYRRPAEAAAEKEMWEC